MAENAPPTPSAPPPVPTNGNKKFILLALLLLGFIAAAIFWKLNQKGPEPVGPIDAGVPTTPTTGRNLDEEVPLPPPTEDAGPEEDAGKKVATTTSSGCEAKKCSGTSTPDLEMALQHRVKQARRCYNNALGLDPTLRGKVVMAVRVGASGQVCSASVVSNDMGSPQVATCVAGHFRGMNMPAPRGGCVEVNIPINFVPGQ